VNELDIVGDELAARQNWNFSGPFKEMTFASRMQHLIYWGPLKRPLEWSLKTWLAPWSYIASVLYHDAYWYPFKSKRQMKQCLASEWGRLFENWGKVEATEEGFPNPGTEKPEYRRGFWGLLKEAARILVLCIKEAPEFAARRRRAAHR